MFKLIFIFGILAIAWGDEYHPVHDHHPVRDHYHPVHKQNNPQYPVPESKQTGDRYHPHNSTPNRKLRDHYNPNRAYYNTQRVDEKIIGGQETTIDDLPYQVSLRFITTHTCGAAILDETTVITAAHCVYGRRSSSFTLLTGTTYINDNTHPGKLSFVDRAIIHEGYNTTSQDNDIAILKLFMPLKFSDKIKPIALQDAGVAVPPQTGATVSGWGRMEEGKPNPPGPFALRKVTVAALSGADCESRYTGKLTGSMMCAQSSGKDSCQGDSGGPLVANNKLVGVVSWGYGCARPEYPGVYTSVAVLRPWIEAHRND